MNLTVNFTFFRAAAASALASRLLAPFLADLRDCFTEVISLSAVLARFVGSARSALLDLLRPVLALGAILDR